MLRTLLSTGSRLAAQDARLVCQGTNTFHTSTKAGMGFGSHASDNDPDVLHKEKEKNLAGTARHVPISRGLSGEACSAALGQDSFNTVSNIFDRVPAHLTHMGPVLESRELGLKLLCLNSRPGKELSPWR